jgi:hypothetical protein
MESGVMGDGLGWRGSNSIAWTIAPKSGIEHTMNIGGRKDEAGARKKIKIRANRLMKTGILSHDQCVGEKAGRRALTMVLSTEKNQTARPQPRRKSRISTNELLNTEI